MTIKRKGLSREMARINLEVTISKFIRAISRPVLILNYLLKRASTLFAFKEFPVERCNSAIALLSSV